LNTNDVKHTIQADIIEKEEEQTDRCIKLPHLRTGVRAREQREKRKGMHYLLPP